MTNSSNPTNEDGTQCNEVSIKEPEGDQIIVFDREKVRRLNQKYSEALLGKSQMLKFEGLDLYVPYVRYLLEYLEERLDG